MGPVESLIQTNQLLKKSFLANEGKLVLDDTNKLRLILLGVIMSLQHDLKKKKKDFLKCRQILNINKWHDVYNLL